MESKENDWLLSNLVNPNTPVSDFRAAGFSAVNTSLESEDTYKSKKAILTSTLFQTDGKFDESKFHNYYLGLANSYGHLADETYYEDLTKNAVYHSGNIWANPLLKKNLFEFTTENLVREANPTRQATGIRRLGLTEAPKFSSREIAQTLKVLANPVAATREDGSIDPSIAIWLDSPNDSFWSNFGETRVLAKWDEDGWHIDPITNQRMQHSKDELKINENGTYYYENLDGRDIYGREVLSKWDTLTEDGSAMNSIDFFDSDDLEKSLGGSIMRAVVEVAPMFTPVAPYYVGLRVGLSLAKSAANLGKVLTGSDNPMLSSIEGFISSTDFSQSDYASQHPWSLENIVNMVGDVFSLMEEQRWVFKYLPSLLKGNKLGFSESARLDFEEKMQLEYLKNVVFKREVTPSNLALDNHELQAMKIAYANRKMAAIDKQFLKTGELMSQAYMTGVTTVDAYGEAKQQGASDFEAAALSLIYMAGEFGILKTDLAKWVLPELRIDKLKYKLVAKVLTAIQEQPAPAADATKAEKTKWFLDIARKGLNILKGEYSAAEMSAGSVLANSLGEGTEEVVEELWADASKSIVNLGVWLSGEGKLLTAWDNMIDRYGLSFVGGTLGGALLQTKLDFQAAKKLKDLKYDDAFLELVTIVRDGKDGDFMREFKKADLNNGYIAALSTQVDAEGNPVIRQGSPNNNQRDAAAQGMQLQINQIKSILNAEGALLSQDALIDRQLLGDLRYEALRRSSTAVRFNKELNSVASEIVSLTNTLTQAQSLPGVVDSHKDEAAKAQATTNSSLIKDTSEKLAKAIEKKNFLISGARAFDFYQNALFEMSHAISGKFYTPTFLAYVEQIEGEEFYKVGESRIKELKSKYEDYCKTQRPDDVAVALGIWRSMYDAGVNDLAQHLTEYYQIDSKLYNPVMRQMEHAEDAFMREAMDPTVVNSAEEVGTYLQHLYDGKVGLSPLSGGNTESRNLQLIKAVLSRFNGEVLANIDEKLAEVAEGDEESYNDVILDELPNALITLASHLYSGNIDNNGTQTDSDGSGLLDGILTRGWVDPKTKSSMMSFVNYLLNQFENIEAEGGFNKEVTPELILEAKEKLYHIQGRKFKTKVNGETIDVEYKSALDDLAHSPITEWLSKFAVSIKKEDGANIAEVLQTLDALAVANIADPSKITLSTKLAQSVDSSIQLLDMAQALLESIKNDNANVANRFGFTTTLNEVMAKSKVKQVDATGKEIDTTQKFLSVDSKHVDPMLFDLSKMRTKLLFFKHLSALNNGAKLSQLDRIDLNTLYNQFRQLKKAIVSIKDDDEGAQELKETIAKLSESDSIMGSIEQALSKKELSREEIFSLDSDKRKQAMKERIALDNAVRKFFSKHINDEAYMVKFIEDNFVKEMFTQDNEISSTNTENLSPSVLINYIASRLAVDTNAFLHKFRGVLGRTIEVGGKTIKVAPVGPQRDQIQLGYSYIMNRKPFDLMQQYARKALANYTATHKDDAKVLKTKGEIIFNVDAPLDSEISPNWLIAFVEGIPGSGKTTAVFSGIAAMLMLDHKEDILRNAWVGHIDATRAEKLKKSIGLDGLAVHMDKELLMNKVVVNYVDNIDPDTGKLKGGVTLESFTKEDANGVRVPDWQIATINPTQVPKVIFIDEVSRYSAFDLWALDLFARKYGTAIVVAGDYDQTKITGETSIGKDDFTFEAYRGNMIHALKLGLSMRAANSLKDLNVKLMLAAMQKLISQHAKVREEVKKTFKLHWYKDELGRLSGDKVEIATDRSKLNDAIKADIDALYTHLNDGEKVGFIKSPTRTAYLDYVEQNYKDKTIFYNETNAQGDELLYYIIEPNEKRTATSDVSGVVGAKIEPLSAAIYWRNVYTGITRSQEASLIIPDVTDKLFDLGQVGVLDTSTVPMDLEQNAVETSILQQEELLDDSMNTEILPEDEIKYIPFVDLDQMPTGEPQKATTPEYNPALLPAVIYSAPSLTIPGEQELVVYTGSELIAKTAPDVPVEEVAEGILETNGKVLKTSELETVDLLNKPEEDDPIPTAEGERANLFLYTNTANHNGWPKVNGLYVKPSEALSRNRIDGFNGLYKLMKQLDPNFEVTPDVIQQWIGIMDMIRGHARDAKTKYDIYNEGELVNYGLTSRVKNALKQLNPNLDLDNVDITFGIKASAHSLRTDGFNRYFVDDASEELDFMHVARAYVKDATSGKMRLETDEEYRNRVKNNTRILDVPKKELVMIVSNKRDVDPSPNDILEVSLAQLPNPVSLIRSEGFESLKAVWDSYDKRTPFAERVYKLRQHLDAVTPDSVPFLQGLKNLADLFLWGNGKIEEMRVGRPLLAAERAKFNQFFPITDKNWTFGMFDFTGPDLVNQVKGSSNERNKYEVGDYDYEGEWMTLQEFANEHGQLNSDGDRITTTDGTPIEGSRYVSPVMFARYGTFEIGGVAKTYAQPGHPFVLVSDSPEISTFKLAQEQFLTLFKNAGGDISKMYKNNPKVRLVYVNSPLASVLEYFENAHKIMTGLSGSFFIGNDFTAFRIYETLKQEIPNKFNEWLGIELAKMPELTLALDRLSELQAEKEEIIAKRAQALQSGNVPLALTLSKQYEDKVREQLDFLTGENHKVKTVYAKKPITIKQALNGLLGDLVISENVISERLEKWTNNGLEVSNEAFALDLNKLAVIANALAKHHIYGIYYSPRGKVGSDNSDMIQVATTGNNYEINGHPFTINGKLNTPTAKGDASVILNAFAAIANDLEALKKASVSYISGKVSELTADKKQELPKTKILKIVEDSKIQGPSTVIDSLLEVYKDNNGITIEEILDVLKSTGHVYWQTSDGIFVAEPMPELKGKSYEVTYVLDPAPLNPGHILVTLQQDDVETRNYVGTIDPSTKEIKFTCERIIKPKVEGGVIQVKPVFDESQGELKTLFNTIMQLVFRNNEKLAKIMSNASIDQASFSLDTVEDFINALNNAKPAVKKKILTEVINKLLNSTTNSSYDALIINSLQLLVNYINYMTDINSLSNTTELKLDCDPRIVKF